MYLIDTDVISGLHKTNPDRNLMAWMVDQNPTDLFLSVVTIGEIQRGIALQERKNPDLARSLAEWRDSVLDQYNGRILPVRLEDSWRWGNLSAMLGNNNPDLLIAATALENNLIMVTRNTHHFVPTGVPTFNPFLPP